jgi:hypothetical protein
MDTLYIVDDEYTEAASKVLEKSQRMQAIWDSFITESESIVSAQGPLQGSRASAYSQFIEVAKANMTTQFLDAGTLASQDLETYVSMIDEADNVLY